MQIRTIVLGVLALTCGASAVVGVNQLSRQWETPTSLVETVDVVTAVTDVSRGSLLSSKVLSLRKWPKEMVPLGALTSIADASERSVLVPLVKGEPVLESKLASKDAGRGLAAMIPKGMRAFTIQTPTAVAGVGGFILPGDNVDVLLTTTSSGPTDPTGGGATATLLQNVRILAVAQHLDAPDENKVDPKEMNSVTLLVTPEQAAKLDLGMNKGTLHLSLRNPEDDAMQRPGTATMVELPARSGGSSDLAKTAASVFSAVAKSLTDPNRAKVERKPATLWGDDQEVAQIRTIRGVHRGSIRVVTAK
jgi:pilus assembly protein CpaB